MGVWRGETVMGGLAIIQVFICIPVGPSWMLPFAFFFPFSKKTWCQEPSRGS